MKINERCPHCNKFSIKYSFTEEEVKILKDKKAIPLDLKCNECARGSSWLVSLIDGKLKIIYND